MPFYQVKRSKINIFGEHYVVLSSLKTPWYDENVEKPSLNWNWTLMMECRSYTTARPLINAVTMFLGHVRYFLGPFHERKGPSWGSRSNPIVTRWPLQIWIHDDTWLLERVESPWDNHHFQGEVVVVPDFYKLCSAMCIVVCVHS